MSNLTELTYTSDEMMAVAASRTLVDEEVVFVGIGHPSTAANLARRSHAPNLVMIYESGTIGAKPTRLPLSIGDGELGDTADFIVSIPEIFNYWLQPGRISVGFLGAAQIDKFCNLNSTVIGDYLSPTTRLPGAGGAPEIASACQRCVIMLKQSKRSFVERVDFITTYGFGDGGTARAKLNLVGAGPSQVITDLGVYQPDPISKELILTQIHPGTTLEQVQATVGWELKVSPDLRTSPTPTEVELALLRTLTRPES